LRSRCSFFTFARLWNSAAIFFLSLDSHIKVRVAGAAFDFRSLILAGRILGCGYAPSHGKYNEERQNGH
jgi:hypothetical protein